MKDYTENGIVKIMCNDCNGEGGCGGGGARGANIEEVASEDLLDGTGAGKPNYEKIKFCGEQARSDGLRHFWVDTCCIDKANNNEFAEAIDSMFR